MRTSVGYLLVALFAIGGAAPTALGQCSVGPSDESCVIPAERECPNGELYVHHDFTFEWGYCWQFTGVQPPYYGAFGEAYGLGAGDVDCGAFWMTCIGYWVYPDLAVYVWDGGISRPPGEVLAMVPLDRWDNLPYWPDVGQNDIEIGVSVSGEFTVGYWMDWSVHVCDGFVGADQDGPGGHPWTCIAPGQEWPSGWQDPAIVWGPTASLGIGVYFSRDPASVDEHPGNWESSQAPTWGSIKALFQ